MNKKIFKGLIVGFLALSCLFISSCGKEETENELSLEDVVISSAQSETTAEEQDKQGESLPCAVDGNVSYSSSVYLLMLQESFQNLSLSTNLDLSQVLNTTLKLSDGSICSGSEYVAEEAENSFRRHYLVERLCRQAELEVSESDYYPMCLIYAANAYKEAPEYYDFFNIDTADLLEYYMSKYRYNDLFYALYGKGGEKEISKNRLEKLMSDSVYRIQYIMMPLSDDNGNVLSEDEIAKRKELCSDYLGRFEQGESFPQLVFESYRYLDEGVERLEDSSYDYYGSSSDGFSPEIRKAISELEDGDCALVDSEKYSAVVLRLPVNEDQGDKWYTAALQLAYSEEEGREYDSYIAQQLASIEPQYNMGVKALLTPENYAALLAEYTSEG